MSSNLLSRSSSRMPLNRQQYISYCTTQNSCYGFWTVLFSMRTSIPFRLWTSQPLCRRTIHTTSVSCNVETYGSRSSVTSPTQTVQSPTFEAAGIRAPIASALRKAFPNIKHPTDAQNNFIPAILNGMRNTLLGLSCLTCNQAAMLC